LVKTPIDDPLFPVWPVADEILLVLWVASMIFVQVASADELWLESLALACGDRFAA